MALNYLDEQREEAYRNKHGMPPKPQPQPVQMPQGVADPAPKSVTGMPNVLPPQPSVADPAKATLDLFK